MARYQPQQLSQQQSQSRSQWGPQISKVTLRQGSHFANTNNLYQPLRQTLQHPEIVRQHAQLTPILAQSSLVSKEYRRLDSNQLRDLENNMYIPDYELVPTNNLDLVKNEHFFAVDACERIAGPPISAEEMQRIRRAGVKSSQVVYQPRQPQHEVIEKPTKVVSKPPPEPEPVPVLATPQERYSSVAYDTYGKNPEKYKYNLFSSIDQPVNECRQFGCGHCTGCPSNECIAHQNRPTSISRT